MVCVEEAYYYMQRHAKWQAPCYETPPAVQVWGMGRQPHRRCQAEGGQPDPG